MMLSVAMCAQAADAQQRDAEPAQRELLQPPPEIAYSPIEDRFAMRASYFQPDMTTQLRYDVSPTQQGTPISAEDTLGMDDRLNQAVLEMMVRLRPRHRLRADYMKFSRDGSAPLGDIIDFGNDTFLADELVESSIDMRLLGLTYTWSLLRLPRAELGLGLGVHLVEAKGTAEVPARSEGEAFSVTGPLPTFALDGTVMLTKRFSLNARVQYLAPTIGEVSGSFTHYHADVQFRAWPNLSFGLGYTGYTARVDSTDSAFTGRFVMKARGPELFARVSF
jgi:hypothetical protein